MPSLGTEPMLRMAGIRPGMRVLDLGCGAGDLTMLLARLVGPAGSVTGIDRRAGELTLAERRTESAGLFWVEFRQATVEEFTASGPFDAAIGSDVLFRQPDPAAFLRSAARHVRDGGVLGLRETSASWFLTVVRR
jgi:2-polyprenyl-3-methyl-5-hydroxy-6-metoxy-1,4-benzoquinol methylase